MVLRGEAKEAIIDEEGVLRIKGRRPIFQTYSIHPGATKMYHDLKQHFWRSRMKRDIVDFVAQCPNCQHVNNEHQRPGGTFHRMPIPEWKWERIAMDFVVCLPKTLGKFDSLWRESLEKMKFIQEKLLAAQSRQKEYADRKVRDLNFMEGQLLLKVSSMKGVMQFVKQGKLSPRYIGSFEVLKRVGEVSYELVLPPGLSGVHPVFHVSVLKKYHGDGNYIIHWDSVLLDENLSYEVEPFAILDREVRKLT
ncbi:uncharacterized protein [Solanum lycopersicum]|uniref:uncharacterized protein n=1 Tax=Solanum lycopersicum TaxID=4081 RepID=UPI003747C8A8